MGMYGGGAAPSLADIAAVTRDGNNNDGFGNGNGWWVLIILFAIFGGWGNGWGNNGNNGGCEKETTIVNMPPMGMYGGYGMGGFGFSEAALQRGFDTQTIINKLDGINSGICSLGYDQLAQMNGINSNIMQTGFGLSNAITNSTFTLSNAINDNTVAGMQNANALSRQMADCCCENRAAIAQVRYDMATDTCALKTQVHETGDAIIQNQNQNFQQLNNTIRDGFCALEMREMQRENQALRDKLNACDRDSALLAQSNYLVNTLRPTAQPAFITRNPNTGAIWPQGGCAIPVRVQDGCGCNSGCGTCCG